jgi:hypothetical protein
MAARGLLAGFFATALLWTACQDAPETPQRTNSSPSQRQNVPAPNRPSTLDDMFDELAIRVPGFAGLYLNDAGELVVRMVGGQGRADMRTRIRDVMGVIPGRPDRDIHFLDAKYNFHALRVFEQSILRNVTLPDYSVLDINEARNKVVLMLPNAADISIARGAARRLPIPEDALEFVIQAPAIPLSTLQDSTNPPIGGIQIETRFNITSAHTCTGGFNAKLPGDTTKLYLVTNGHCTATMGAVDGDTLFQNTIVGGPPLSHKIGIEYAEAGYSSSDPACPTGRTCSYGDASMFRYDNASRGTLGVLARTPHYNDALHGININRDTHDFPLTGELPSGFFVANQWMAKVGRTTGWSAGRIDSSFTCVAFYFPTNHAYICQYAVYDAVNAGAGNFVDGGDSGSPVFLPVYSEDDVYGGVNWLAGLLHSKSTRSGDNKDIFFFAPLYLLKNDLGALITVPGGGCVPNAFLNGCQ